MFLYVMIDSVENVFFTFFLRISTHISLGIYFLGSAEANIGWGGLKRV